MCAHTFSPAAKKKPQSETYKKAWSIYEKHLKRLLSEIPDGEKYRYEWPICCPACENAH